MLEMTCSRAEEVRKMSKPERVLLPPDGLYTPTYAEVSMSDQSTPTPVSVQYRDIPGFPGYRVGDDGSVWTLKAKGGNDRTPGRLSETWRLLKINRTRTGYCLVNLDRNGRNHTRQVHRLVLLAFVGPRPDGMEACHYPDHDKTNNRLGNLRWDTHGENGKDRYRNRGLVTEKTCRLCGDTKPAAQFPPDKRVSDKLASRCRKCEYIRRIRRKGGTS